MAQYSYARLTANGEPLTGDVTQMQVGDLDVSSEHLEVLSLAFGVDTARQAATSRATGRRTYRPVTFVKRVDRTTPLLYRALAQNERIEGRFVLFGVDPADGAVRRLLTVDVEEGAVISVADVAPDVREPAVSSWDPYEEVSVLFGRVTIAHPPSGSEFQDHVRREF